MKNLTINDVIYAIYEMDGTRLYLKMLVQIDEDDEDLSENFLILLIQVVEKKQFEFVSYLNVPIP